MRVKLCDKKKPNNQGIQGQISIGLPLDLSTEFEAETASVTLLFPPTLSTS